MKEVPIKKLKETNKTKTKTRLLAAQWCNGISSKLYLVGAKPWKDISELEWLEAWKEVGIILKKLNKISPVDTGAMKQLRSLVFNVHQQYIISKDR